MLVRKDLIVPFVLFTAFMFILLSGCGGRNSDKPDEPEEIVQYTYKVNYIYPHDENAFTQGLVYYDGMIYEGTGRYGESEVRRVNLTTGIWDSKATLPEDHFGEGITILDETLYQLTWKAGICYVRGLDGFGTTENFEYEGEGWGLTDDGKDLIMSNGTDTLYFRDTEDFRIVKSLKVTYDGESIDNLNELEYIDGSIYANVWQEDRILIVSPETGYVIGNIDMAKLLQNADATGKENVLNGIAYDEDGGRLYVTGKMWPSLFEIEVVKK